MWKFGNAIKPLFADLVTFLNACILVIPGAILLKVDMWTIDDGGDFHSKVHFDL